MSNSNTGSFKFTLNSKVLDLSAIFLPITLGYSTTSSNFYITDNRDFNELFAKKSNTTKKANFTTGFRYTQGSNIYDLSDLFEKMPPCVISNNTGFTQSAMNKNPVVTTLASDYTFIVFTGNDTSVNTSASANIMFTKSMLVYYIIVGTGAPGSNGAQGNGGDGGCCALGYFTCIDNHNYTVKIEYNSNNNATVNRSMFMYDTNNYIYANNGNLSNNSAAIYGTGSYFNNNNYYSIFYRGGAGGNYTSSQGAGRGLEVNNSNVINSISSGGVYTISVVNTIKFNNTNMPTIYIGNGGGSSGGTNGAVGGYGGSGSSSNGVGEIPGFNYPGAGGGGGRGDNGGTDGNGKGGDGGFYRINQNTRVTNSQSYGNGGGGGVNGGGKGSGGVVILYFLTSSY